MTRKQFTHILTRPASIILLLSLALFSINMALTYKVRPFNSDDVFWQTILLHWHPFDGTKVTLGNSSIYVDKIPLYELFNHLFGASRKVLFLEAASAALAGFTLFYLSCLYFLKKANVGLSYTNLLPFLWLSSFGYSFLHLYLNPNWRGFQLGLSFVAFALAAAVFYGDIRVKTWWSKVLLVLLGIYAGLQMHSDPYFLYFTIGPLILLSIFLLATHKIKLRPFFVIFTPLLLGLVFYKLFGVVSKAAGVRSAEEYPMEFIHFENIGDSFSASVHSILIIFGSDFFGLALKTFGTAVALVNFALLSFIVFWLFSFLHKVRTQKWAEISNQNIWQAFLISVCFLVFGSHSISTLGIGTYTYRYFLLLVLVFVLLFSLVLGAMKNGRKKNILAALIVCSITFNTVFTITNIQNSATPDAASNRANALNYAIISAVKEKGYEKGYAHYWDATISTYLSGGKISFLPSVCTNKNAKKWHWLINDSAFDARAGKSFYLYNPDAQPASACKLKDIIRQLGPPKERVLVGNKTILLFDYDISSKMKTVH